MAKKFFPRALSVGLSLALCAGMVAPAFAAAVAFDKDYHVGENGELLSHKEEVDGEFVQSYDYYLAGDVELDKTLIIKDGANASIDLNGHELALNKGQQVNTETGAVTGNEKTGSVISVKGENTSLTVTDNSDEKSGTITGGYVKPQYGEGYGGGIKVDDGASLDFQGGTITNNAANNGGGIYVGKGTATMSGDAKIDGNLAGHNGGGVYVNAQGAYMSGSSAQFTMNGGTISNNTASGTDAYGNIVGGGGGIGAVLYNEAEATNYNTIEVNGGTITGNRAEVDGAGIYGSNVKVSVKDRLDENGESVKSVISNNTAAAIQGNGTRQNGGGIYLNGNKGKVEVSNTTISGNDATWGGGIYVQNKAELKLNGSEVSENTANVGGGIFASNSTATIGKTSKVFDNTAETHSDDVYSNGTKLTLYIVDGMNATLGEDGKPITGWYKDGSTRWGDGYNELDLPFKPGTVYSSGIFCLKAAHDEYFDVVYTDGADGTLFADQKYEVENENSVPVFSGEIPSRPGYTFAGWLVDGENFDPATGTVTGTLTLVAAWIQNPVTVDPETPDLPDDTGETEIDDQAIPLAAGPVTRAEFIDYLWRHEGEPASDGVCTFTDVPEDHQFVLALAWAEQNGIAEAYLGAEGHEDGTFEPDELVTVGDVREFLGNFARVFGGNAVDVADLTTLTGSDDEAVLNCDQVIAEFFGEEYTPANTKNDELDIAA